MYIRNWLNFLVIRHFSGSLQNAYLGEELKGVVLSKFNLFSALGGLWPSDPLTRGSAPGPRWGSAPRPPHSEEIVATVTVIRTADLVTFTGEAREVVYKRKTVNITDRTKLTRT